MTARRTHISIFGKDYPIPPKGLYAGVPGKGPQGKECRHCQYRDKRSSSQILAWAEKYGEQNPQWLPPSGDVRLLEDIAEAIAKAKP